jgi:hypothetical protein
MGRKRSMENITKYPSYGARQKELSVKCSGDLVFLGKALIILEEQTPVVIFFDFETVPCFRIRFGKLSSASDTLDDLLGLEILFAAAQDRIAFKLIGASGYASIQSVDRESVRFVTRRPAT